MRLMPCSACHRISGTAHLGERRSWCTDVVGQVAQIIFTLPCTGFILPMGKGVSTTTSVHQGLHETGMLTAVMQAGMLLCSAASLSLH